MDPNEITFEVAGLPVPQPRPKVSTRGGIGRAYTPAAHEIHAYRAAIVIVARTRGWADGPTAGPVSVEADAWFPRPESHLTKAGTLSSKARIWPSRADVDNLAKGMLDAITDAGSFWLDDDQVVELTIRKAYARPRSPGRTIITVRRVNVLPP